MGNFTPPPPHPTPPHSPPHPTPPHENSRDYVQKTQGNSKFMSSALGHPEKLCETEIRWIIADLLAFIRVFRYRTEKR
jgi:hypothetical protein